MDGVLRRARLARSRLCVVLEARPHGTDPEALLDAALRGGVDVVRLRDEALGDDELVAAAAPFRRACGAHGALFVLDDRPELVERCGADGVHLGQSDASAADARRLVGPDRLVGLSAATPQELSAAASAADYLRVGALVGTSAEPESAPGGLGLVRAARDSVGVPWFASGVVELDDVAELAASGAAGVTVMRAIRDAGDPEAAARALRAALPPTEAVLVDAGSGALLPQLDWLEAASAADAPGASPHTHRSHTDVFYVLDGELEFRVGDETVRLPAGSCVAAPPLLVHGFRNPAANPAGYVNLHAHGGWARGRAHGLDATKYDTFLGADRPPSTVRGIVTGPGDGDRLRTEHRLALVKALTPQASVLEYHVSAGYTGAEAHVHLRHADAFRVLEGELEFRLGDATIRAGAGTGLVIPPGVVHAFTSVGARARFLNVHAPDCGFVDHLRAVDAGEPVDSSRGDVYDLAG